MPSFRTVAFLPWVTLQSAHAVGGFRFTPVDANAPSLGSDEADETFARILASYRGLDGKAVRSCTAVLRLRHDQPWFIPSTMHQKVSEAARLLALAALSEQRFYERGGHEHANASIFHLVAQGAPQGARTAALIIARRGGQMLAGGLKFADLHIQAPQQVLWTSCPRIPRHFSRALDRARTGGGRAWRAIKASLPYFLLANEENPPLPLEGWITLSVIAFEALLAADGPANGTALALSKAFADLWHTSETVTLQQAERIAPDASPQHAAEQMKWPLRRKWMKELYEARSEFVHLNPRKELSRNWTLEHSVVVAAFAYPLAVKLLLAREDLYTPTDEDLGAIDALDHLLLAKPPKGWKRSDWPMILSRWEQSRALDRIIRDAMRSRGGELPSDPPPG